MSSEQQQEFKSEILIEYVGGEVEEIRSRDVLWILFDSKSDVLEIHNGTKPDVAGTNQDCCYQWKWIRSVSATGDVRLAQI